MLYRGIQNLEVPETLEIPTCNGCGEELFNSEIADRIHAAMEPIYRAYLRKLAKDSIEEITQANVRQSELEQALGLAQGYITKLKTGKKTPSLEFAIHLARIAKNPKDSLSQIKSLLIAR